MTEFKKHNNRIALEMIALQDSSFGNQIEAIVDKIILKLNDRIVIENTSSDVLELETLIFKRLGLKINLTVNKDLAAVLPFYINKNSIFINPLYRGMDLDINCQNKVIAQAANKKGTVDIKKAKVSGIFSEYTVQMYINFTSLYKRYRMSSSEIAAIMLHELGHAFYVCEYADRLESTNQILANIAKEVLDKSKPTNQTYVYTELKKLDAKVTKEEVEAIVSPTGNRTIASYKLFNIVVGSIKSQSLDAKYDESSFEQMADNFASRFGYGKQLIMGLDKLHDVHGIEKSMTAITLCNMMSSLVFMGFIVIIIAAIVTGVVLGGIYFTCLFALLLFTSGDRCDDLTYDDLKTRYLRVRNESIGMLKNNDITKAESQQIIETIHNMDAVIASTYTSKNTFKIVSNVIFSTNRTANRAINEEKLLESLASNDLFLKAAEFKHL